MKTSLLLALSTLVYSYVPNPPARHNRNGLNYKNQEFEYGTGDDRVRTLSSDDRVSVLKLLEIEVAINKSTYTQQHLEPSPISSPKMSSPSIVAQSNTHGTWTDVDADRSSLASLLEPPTPPLTKEELTKKTLRTPHKQSPSRLTTSQSTITALESIDDYNHHILSSESNRLKLIRFSAPWCQVCRTTNVAFERMTSKLAKSGDVQFYSVVIDSNKPSDTKNVLKDHLSVYAVPTGVLYHPSKGVIGRVNLNRVNLSELKKRLEGYVSGALHRQGEMMWVEALVMGLEIGEQGKM